VTRIAIAWHGAVFALALMARPAAAQDTPSPPWVRETIQSARLSEERVLLVSTPLGYEATADSFPILVILDAGDRPQFEAAIANIRFLASRNEIPDLIIAGLPNGRDRSHDLTPPATGATREEIPTAGGADAFADFITDEVLPLVRQKYRTRPVTLLAGHSFGGLFVLHVVANRSHPYAGVIAMSPSLWWNDTTVVTTYSEAIAAKPDGPRLFITSGGYEGDIDRPARAFAAQLDRLAPRGIPYRYLRLPEDTHGLTPQASLIAGLRYVFEPVSIARLPISDFGPGTDSATFINMFSTSEAMYARGARALGLPDKLPEGLVNQLGYEALQFLKLPGVAVSLFARNVANYPASANVHDSYGDGLAAVGDTTGAVGQYRQAVTLAEAEGNTNLAGVSRRKVAALEEARAKGKASP
jgi:predicted alpha/beta superfamily hydrolase